MVVSDTRQLTGRPKLLLFTKNTLAMNNTGSAKLWVGDKGIGKRFWLTSSRSGKKTQFENTR